MMRRFSRRWTDQRGMTLVEILVVVAVVGVLMAIAIPAVQSHIALQELRGAAREVVEVLRDTRSAAVDEGVPRYVLFDPATQTYQPFRYAGPGWAAETAPQELPTSVTFSVTFSNVALAGEPEASAAPVPGDAAYFDTRGAYPYHSSLPASYSITLSGGLDRTETLTLHTSTGQVTGQ